MHDRFRSKLRTFAPREGWRHFWFGFSRAVDVPIGWWWIHDVRPYPYTEPEAALADWKAVGDDFLEVIDNLPSERTPAA